MIKLVILDRDGTLNAPVDEEDFIATAEDWQPLPGALEAVARLSRAGRHQHHCRRLPRRTAAGATLRAELARCPRTRFNPWESSP